MGLHTNLAEHSLRCESSQSAHSEANTTTAERLGRLEDDVGQIKVGLQAMARSNREDLQALKEMVSALATAKGNRDLVKEWRWTIGDQSMVA